MTDPFDGLELGDDFVAQATVVEPSADERVARVQRIRAEHDAMRHERPAAPRPKGRRRARDLVVVVCAVAAVAWLATRDDKAAYIAGVEDRPPPGVGAAATPLALPPPAPVPGGAHAFVATNDDEAVAYDPCRPIHLVVNWRTAPPGVEPLLDRALADVTAATGLVFQVDGPTDEVPSAQRAPFQSDRYGQRWAPVLVAWSDAEETVDLAGDVAGQAGSVPVPDIDGELVYVSGQVVLDGPDLGTSLAFFGADGVLAVLRHELAHLVGLDHVDDPSQLMHPTAMGVDDFAAGDRTGLAALGGGPCRPSL